MSANRGRFVLITLAIVLTLATLGMYQLDPQGFRDSPSNQLYRVAQLLVLEGDWTTQYEQLPVSLQIARFAAPFVTVASLVLLFAEGIWTALVNSRLRFFKDHIVVVGLNEQSLQLVTQCAADGTNVVVVDIDPDNPRLKVCRDMRVPVVIGDCLQARTLNRARAANANALLSFLEGDGVNIELSLVTQNVVELLPDRSDRPLKVILLGVNDLQLASHLERYPKFSDHPTQIEVRFFNPDEQAARGLFRDYQPDVYADALGVGHVHIVVVGYGSLGRNVVLQALQQAHYGNHDPLYVTVLTPDAVEQREAFERRCPDVPVAAIVHFVQAEQDPDIIGANAREFGLASATMYVCCPGSDSDNLSMALALRQLSITGVIPNAPVFAGLRNADGLARLVESGSGNPEIPDGLFPFGTSETLLRIERLVDEQQDRVAMAFHDAYLESAVQPGRPRKTSQRPWSSLPEVYRRENRAETDHLSAKLRAAGCRLDNDAFTFSFSDEQIECLAHMEKNRWNGMRASRGWRYAEHRSEFAKAHNQLRPWNDLNDEERFNDLHTVRSVPTIIQRRLALSIHPEVVIGVTGHRPERINGFLPRLNEQVLQVLDKIAATYPDARFSVMSSLAEGSDRLLATIAMQRLDAQLYVPLPMPYEVYSQQFGQDPEQDFDSSLREFQVLVGRSTRYFELPLRFGPAQVLERADDTGHTARACQYALAGAYIVQRSHELVAVWDGLPERGEGGTAQIIRWRQQGQVPAKYAFEARFFPPPPQLPPRIIEVPKPDSVAAG